MKWMIGFILSLGLLGGPIWAEDNKASTGDAKTDEAVVDVQKKRGDTAMCQARLVTLYKIMDQEIGETSDAFFKAPGLMFLGTLEDDKWVPAMVSDRGMLWTYDAEEKMVTKFNRGRIYRETQLEVDAYIPDPLRPFRGVVWESIRLKNTTPDVYVFEADLQANLLSAQLPSALVKVLLAVSKKDGLLRTVQSFDAEGNEVVVRQFEDVRTNEKISDKMFEFVIPAGAHVMDGTGDAVQLLKALSASE